MLAWFGVACFKRYYPLTQRAPLTPVTLGLGKMTMAQLCTLSQLFEAIEAGQLILSEMQRVYMQVCTSLSLKYILRQESIQALNAGTYIDTNIYTCKHKNAFVEVKPFYVAERAFVCQTGGPWGME